MSRKWMVLIWIVANVAILFAIFMNKQTVQTPLDTSSYDARIEELREEIETLEGKKSMLEEIVSATPIESGFRDSYNLDRPIYEVKFRNTEQREIWIKRNNESANFSDELISWLRNQDTFYVSDIIRFYKDEISIDPDSFIILPPCPQNLQDGTQPILYKTRLTIIRQVSKDEYLAAVK